MNEMLKMHLVSTGKSVTDGPEAIAGSVGVISYTSALISLAHGGVHRYQYGENGTIQYQWGEREAEV